MNKKQESNCACCQVVDFSKDGFKHLMRHAVFEREAKIDICKTNLILNFRPNEDEYPEFARINAMLVEADRVIVTQKQTKRLINELIEAQGIGLFVDRACIGLKQKKRIAPFAAGGSHRVRCPPPVPCREELLRRFRSNILRLGKYRLSCDGRGEQHSSK